MLRTLFFVSPFEHKFGNSLMVGLRSIAGFLGWSRAEASNQNFYFWGSETHMGFMSQQNLQMLYLPNAYMPRFAILEDTPNALLP